MPTSSEILAGLALIANELFVIAVAWHALVAAVLILLASGWRPSSRRVAVGLAAPLASVSALAWAYGNPFNGLVFAGLAAAIAWLGAGAPRTPIPGATTWTAGAGGVLLAYAWLYPHFLEGQSVTAYLYGSPMGLIPCPTLSLVIGLVLVTGAAVGRAWRLALAGAALFYALFGMLRLGVWLDAGLLAGGLALLAQPWPRAAKPAKLRGVAKRAGAA